MAGQSLREAAEAGALLTMTQTAHAIGVSYDHFRKTWPELRAAQAFPSPVRGRAWLASAVLAWMVERSGAAPPAAPRAVPARRGADHAWSQLERLRGL